MSIPPPPPPVASTVSTRVRVNDWLPRVHKVGVYQGVFKGAQVLEAFKCHHNGRHPVLWLVVTTPQDTTYGEGECMRVPHKTFTAYVLHSDPHATLPSNQ